MSNSKRSSYGTFVDGKNSDQSTVETPNKRSSYGTISNEELNAINNKNNTPKEIPAIDKIFLDDAKSKLAKGENLNASERGLISKYGLYGISTLQTSEIFDLFASDNPQNTSRFEKIKLIKAKEDKGIALTTEEKDFVETTKLINFLKKGYASNLITLTDDKNQNGNNAAILGAMKLYNDTAYNNNEFKIGTQTFKVDDKNSVSRFLGNNQQFQNRQNLYVNTGLDQYVRGVENTFDVVFGGARSKEMSEKPNSAYSIASNTLRQYYLKNNKQANIAMQDVVTNVAQNAIPMLTAILTAGLTGGASASLSSSTSQITRLVGTALSKAPQFASQAAFAASCFGNSYEEASKMMDTPNDGRVFTYAMLTTGSELFLNAVFDIATYGGAKLAGYEGPKNLTSNIIESISSSLKSPYAKAATYVIGSGLGEFPEEFAQSILAPILQKYILGVDVDTVFDNPIEQLSSAAYEGFIGFLSGTLMGIGNASTGFREASIQNIGNQYNDIFAKADIDVKNIAQYFIETAEKGSDLFKKAQTVLDGNTSDIAVGEMMNEALKENAKANDIVYIKIGENVKSRENGVFDIIEEYQKLSEGGLIFPSNVVELYDNITSFGVDDEIPNRLVGEFSLAVQTYTPRALLMREMMVKVSEQNPSLQNGDDNDIISNNEQVGDEANVGQQDVNDSERSRGESSDTESGIGTLQGHDGGSNREVQSNGNFGRSSQMFPNQRNNRRIEPTAEQKESLKTTAIKGENGNPKVVSHFTDNMDFEAFEKGDIGFHFGNEQQAVERGKNLKKSGRIIKAHLDIKNPLNIPTDLMNWTPFNIAFKLSVEGVISADDYAKIITLTNEGGSDYNSPAAVELRKILGDLGYDGIVYENMFEADGESYIAFYPEQVIIIGDGKNQADPNGPANFMPEGENEGEVGLSEPSVKEIHRVPTSQEENEAIFGKRKDAKQRHILDVAKKLDSNMTVVFVDPDSDKLSGQKGAYMHDTNTVYISTDNSIVGMYCQIFKHEFVHRLESKQAYQGFKNYLFNQSSAFERYIRAELKRINGADFDGTREEAIKALSDHYIDLVKKSSFTEEYKRNFSSEYAEREMVANFVGKILFKGKENIADVAQSLSDGEIEKIISLEDAFAEFENLNETERSWFQRIIDAIKDFIASLKGIKQNERLVNDLEYIEQRLARVLDSKDTKKAASRAVDRQYDIAVLENGNTYVKASRNVIKGTTLKEQRKDITNFFKKLLKNKPSIDIPTIEGDVLTLTMAQTEDKARDNYKLVNGTPVKMSQEEFAVKLRVESHIDEIAETSIKSNKPLTNDEKNHDFAKDGFEYRTAYFEDFDGKYYKIRFSIGHNGTVATVYNIGKIKEDVPSSAKLIAVVGSQALDGSSSNDIILNEEDIVKNNISEEAEDYTQNDGEIKQSFALDNPIKEETDGPDAEPSTPNDKPTERFIKTIIETGTLSDEMLEGMHEKLLLGDFSYEVMSDKVALEKAEKTIEYGTAENIWQEVINNNSRISKNQIAIGEKLLAKAIKEKDTKKVLALSSELADVFTRAGQVVQAARLLNKMTGAGRLISAQRTVETLNRDLRAKYGEDFRPIKISDAAAKRLAEAKTKEGIEHAYEEVMYEVAEQTPVTFLDKWNAWRYFAMLSNPKTHIRNIVGNAIFVPAVRIRYFLAASIESAKIKDNSQRTKSVIIKKEYRDFAEKDSKRNEVKQLLKGNKYNDKSAIREKQQTFKSAALNFLTEFNSNALETEDILFKNKHYIHALAGYLQARGLDLKSVPAEVLDDARIYAVEEAKKATFNDESALANAIQRFANKNLATNLLIEGVLPFKRTPINIVKRGVEYSPLGLAKTLTKGIYDVKKGKITPTEYIDGLASGLTGTGIMLVGMFLANLGCVAGGEKEDDESQFEKLLGKQEYAIEFLGKSYTIDWAAPSCIPFFIGVEIVNTLNEGEAFTWSQLGNTVWNSLEPITNLSMISGIQGVIESAKYADSSQTLSAIITDALTSYSMQGIPSLAGAFSRTIDPTQRTWYTDKNSKWFDASSQAFINNVKSKIPGLSYTQIPKIDMWGRVVSRGGTAERVLENFVSPGYYSEMEYTDTNEELKRIFNKTDVDVFPNTAAKSFEVNGKTKHLTADEYVTYATAKGKYSFDYINEFMGDSAYKNLSDEERADVIQGLYEYSNAKAKATVSDYDITKRYKTVTNWEQNGRSAVDYYIYKAITK